jgi:hypothetical protein
MLGAACAGYGAAGRRCAAQALRFLQAVRLIEHHSLRAVRSTSVNASTSRMVFIDRTASS